MFYLYILRTTDNALYIGITNHPNKRFLRHMQKRGSEFTKAHKPEDLVYLEKHPTLTSARKREIQIKNGLDQKKKL